MKRVSLLLAMVVGAIALAGAGSAATPKLSGVAGPGFTITLKSGSKVVKSLKAGTYTVVVSDKSSSHNFHLFGPGVNKTTSVPFTGTKTWTVTLKAGTYTYQCDVHASVGMKGSFKVTS
jgi:Copper binding proteins, plastocyanin/azurin family